MAETKLVYDASGSGAPPVEVELTPEEQARRAAEVAAHGKQQASAAFEAQEDAERLRVIAERAKTDPAYRALSDIVLSGKGL